MRKSFAALTALILVPAQALAGPTAWGQNKPVCATQFRTYTPMRHVTSGNAARYPSPGTVEYVPASGGKTCAKFLPYIGYGFRASDQEICFDDTKGPDASAAFTVSDGFGAVERVPLDPDDINYAHQAREACLQIERGLATPYPMPPIPANLGFPAGRLSTFLLGGPPSAPR